MYFQAGPGERVLLRADATWLRSWWRRPRGRLYFTNQRLVFELDIQTGGVAGIAAINEMRDRFPIDVGRDGLNSAGLERRRNQVVLRIKTDDEILHFANVRVPEDWVTLLQAAIEADRTAIADLVARLEQNAAAGVDGDPYRGGSKK